MPAAILAVALAAGGCAPEPGETPLPDDPEKVHALLRACPEGDRVWRHALELADEERLEDLSGLAAEVDATCPERWEPAWFDGEVLLRRALYAESDAAYRRALERARAGGNPVGVACSANRLGSLGFYRGDLEPARLYFEEALGAAREAKREDLAAFVLNNLSGLLKDLGRLPEAVEMFDEAVRSLASLEGREKPARDAAYNQGLLLVELGDSLRAREILERVYDESVAANDTETSSLASLAFGHMHLALGDPGAARAWIERATHDSPIVGISREMNLARADIAEERLDDAQGRLETAARLAVEHDMGLQALLARAWLGETFARRGRFAEAKARLEEVAAEATERGAVEYAAWIAEWLLGRVHRAGGETELALESGRRAVEILEGQGRGLDPTNEGMHFLLGRTDPYVDLAVTLAANDAREEFREETLHVVELAHARALRHVQGRQGERVGPGSEGSGVTPVTAVRDVQSALRPGELILDYLIGREAGVLVAISSDEVRTRLVPGWSRLAAPVRRYRDALVRPLDGFAAMADPSGDLAADLDAGHAVRVALIDPVADMVAAAHRVYTVPDRELALLPFAALPAADAGDNPDRPVFLGETVDMAVLPLVGMLGGRGPVQGPVLVGGNPIADDAGAFPPLPRTHLEIAEVAKAWDGEGVEQLEQKTFTRSAFLDRPPQRFGTIHLATHAVASTLDPRQCAVIFSGGEALGFDRIAKLELDASLVVLSACRSGEGETIPGQGVVGLGWAFMLAGAQNLAVSLWNVEDAAAAELMGAFHRRLREGDDPVRALASAQSTLRASRWHPAYWAPFVVFVNPGSEPGAGGGK